MIHLYKNVFEDEKGRFILVKSRKTKDGRIEYPINAKCFKIYIELF